MPNSSRQNFIFVDFENRPDVDLRRLNGHAVKVTLLIGKNQPNAAEKLVRSLADVDFEVRLLKMRVTGKNALDLALAFHIGECTARFPQARFFIISGDKKDFGSLEKVMTAQQIDVTRLDALESLPFLQSAAPLMISTPAVVPVPKPKPAPKPKAPPAPVASQPTVDRIAKIINRLRAAAPINRPRTEKKLIAQLKNELKKAPAGHGPDEAFTRMTLEGLFAVLPKGKLRYWDEPAT